VEWEYIANVFNALTEEAVNATKDSTKIKKVFASGLQFRLD
jgi:hypothetical protein